MRWCPRRARGEKGAAGLGWKLKETQKTQKETQKKVLVGYEEARTTEAKGRENFTK